MRRPDRQRHSPGRPPYLNRQIRRRTRVVGLFPNEDSLLRLVSAILMEISEDWETDKIYLNMEALP